jgi:DNA-binding LacI/PurR family transcriptional regulator
MSITLKDVASRAGVSRSAVSRTFTPGASVSKGMRKKVEQAADELGYAPSALASALSTGRSGLVGLVADNFRNPAFMPIFDQFTKDIQDRGLRPLLVNLSGQDDPPAAARMLRQYSVDAVIVASSTLPSGFADAFSGSELPVVHAFGPAHASKTLHVTGVDNVALGRLAAKTLAARGYTDVHMLAGPRDATTTQERLRGFLAEHQRFTKQTYSYSQSYSHAAGRVEMAGLMAKDTTAEAYFCGDDILAIGAGAALRQGQLKVPRDVGLLGVNDIEMSAWPEHNLTTIRQPMDKIITAAVNLVCEGMAAPGGPCRAKFFDCTVVERGSLRSED